ncbi:MAG TPA: 3'-5' exonuclease, partial [Holophaga sp.]|nr:3'-5' exonuclease [Holophaga sp.]
TQIMIDAHNELLLGPDRADSAAFFTDPGLYRAPVRCGNPALEARAGEEPIRPVDLFWVDRASGARLWKRSALALARHLKGLREARIRFGTDLDKEDGAWRTLGYGDMQVLVGKATEGELLARTLRAEGIPCAFYKQKGLFETREAEEWLDALRAVGAPRDRSLQARAFLSRFFDCTLEDLQGLPELPEDHPAVVRLLGWNALARQHRHAELITSLLEDSGLSRRLLLGEEGLRSLVNFRHIGEALQEAAASGSVRLEDLVRQLEHWRSRAEAPASEEGDLQRLEGERGAVQILTLHMAKGLQAPIVAVFAFGKGRSQPVHRFHEDGRRCVHLGSLPSGTLEEAVDQEADEERQRLVYVAITRAQARLVLFAFAEAGSKGALKRLGGAWETMNRRLVARGREGLPAALFQVEDMPLVRLEALPEPAPPDLSVLAPPPLARPGLPDYAALRFQARPAVTTSYTALQHQLERDEEDVRGDRDQPGVRPTQEALPGGTHVGQALHELLEWVDLEAVRQTPFDAWFQKPEVTAAVQEALALHGVPLACEERVARLVHTALTTPLPLGPEGQALRICDADRHLRETDFLMRWVDPDRSPDKDLLKGSIDVLCEQAGRTYLLDWKSNLLSAYDPAALEACVHQSYLLQARIYLKASLAFLGIRDRADYERRFGGILYVFLRGLPEGGTWFHRPSWEEAQAWQAELERLHREVIHA